MSRTVKIPFHQYLNVRSAHSGSLRRDADRLAFLTDITGTSQLWTLDRPLGWPEQLTFYEDRLMFADYSPVDNRIAFGKDQGGDEQQQIYLIADTGGVPEKLSRQDAKHLWGGWSHAGDRLAWSHNARNGRDFDVYVFDLTTGQEELVWQGEGHHYVASWMPEDRGLIVGLPESNFNNNLWLLDLKSGGRTLLTPHQGHAVYYSPRPHPDGRRIFWLTNQGRDFTNLAVYDRATQTFEYVDTYPWNREQIDLSHDGHWLAMLTNEEGFSTVEIWDLVTGERHPVSGLPRGVFSQVRFAGAQPIFTLTVTAPDDTMDVWSVHAETRAVQRWTRSSLAGIPRSSLVAPELIHYESFDGLSIPAFYYKPAGAGPYPVVISIHGGPEGQARPIFNALIQYLVSQGFAVLAPNVRGSSGYGQRYMNLDNVRKRMDSVADIEAAYRWLVTHGNADPRKIALYGGSYGGFMVLSALVTYPDLWAAGVDIVGISNFVTFLENTAAYRRHLREAEYGSLEQDREFLLSISPITHIDKIKAPLMLIHGANDPRVPVGETEQIIEALRAKGVPVEVLIYEDEGHGLAKLKNRLDAYPRVAAFLRKYVMDQ